MRLLLAEDEHELSDALCAILKHNHYSVDPVYDGQEALDYIRHGQYDGAILDIMMPKMDGLTVLRQVRESGNGIPILLLTAKSQVDDRIRGLDMGADGPNPGYDTPTDGDSYQFAAFWRPGSEPGNVQLVWTCRGTAAGQ